MSKGWNIYVMSVSQTNPVHSWNVDGQTYPFLSWEL